MLRLSTATLLCMLAVIACASQPDPKPQDEAGTLSTQETNSQQPPTINVLTPQQIMEAIANGVDRAAKSYEARHPSVPPDNWSSILSW
jgi:hypothetical protein